MPEQRILSEKGVLYLGETMTSNRLQTDKNGVLWAVGRTQTLAGLFCFNEQTGTWMHYASDAYYAPFLMFGLTKTTDPLLLGTVTFFIDAKNCIWFGGWNNGFFCYNTKSGQWQHYYFYKTEKGTLDDNTVLDIYPLGKTDYG